jgi:outer membrane protein assembly factor BamD (BamD/ComL family)
MDYAIYIRINGKWLRADRARRTPWLYSQEDALKEVARLTAEYPGRTYKVALDTWKGC